MTYITVIMKVKHSGRPIGWKNRKKTEEEKTLQRNIWIEQFWMVSPALKRRPLTSRNAYRFKWENCYLQAYHMNMKTNIMKSQPPSYIIPSKVYYTPIKLEDGRPVVVRTSDLIEFVSLILESDFSNAKYYKHDITKFNAWDKTTIDNRPDLLLQSVGSEQYVNPWEKPRKVISDRRRGANRGVEKQKPNDNEKQKGINWTSDEASSWI